MRKRLPPAPPRQAKSVKKCLSCARALAPGGVCWHCCDRPCRVCRRPTGSAFVNICWPCWFRQAGHRQRR